MTARQAEADRAATAYQLALSQIGVRTTAEALALWDHMPPNAKPQVVQNWLTAATRLILHRRSQATELGTAYYRLTRALLTGHTIQDPAQPGRHTIRLGELRQQFNKLTEQARTQIAQSESQSSTPPDQGGESQSGSSPPQQAAGGHENDASLPSAGDDADLVLVEEIKQLEELERQNAQEAEAAIRRDLQYLGPAYQARLIDTLQQDESITAEEADRLRNQYHLQAGTRVAASSARNAMNGARSTTWVAQENDKRALGWVRVSTTGTPCGWCAMLISRGPVYKSKQSASMKGGDLLYVDGDKYHDNCHCIAVPIFSMEQYDSSPKFELNRKYSELWPRVTGGLGGNDALNAWRTFIRHSTGQDATG